MGTQGLTKWVLFLTFWLALHDYILRADDPTIVNNLTATGTIDMQGNTLSLGTGASANPGWLSVYSDGSTSYVDSLGTRDANIWRWWQGASSTAKVQMSLDANCKLTLYDASASPAIMLDPLGTSSFSHGLTVTGSLTVNGNNNQMPYQTLVGANSVLTEGLADNRYILKSVSSLALGGSTASGTSSRALGTGTTASGSNSTAFGSHTTASGANSAAMGLFSTASGPSSMAFGVELSSSGSGSTAVGAYTSASGDFSFVAGGYATASGFASTASGYQTSALGYASIAMGYQTTAQALESFALGQVNVGGGDPNNWVSSDPLFEVGNGTPGIPGSGHYEVDGDGNPIWIPDIAPVPSDAFVVYKNGNATVQGDLTAGGAISTTGTITASGITSSGSVTASGMTTSGTITASGTITSSSGFVTTAASVSATDIPMFVP